MALPDRQSFDVAENSELCLPAAPGRAPRNVLFDLSHDPYTDHPVGTQYASFIAALRAWGFNVSIAGDFANILSYDVVVFSFPQSLFASWQIDLVRSYLDAGKILIIMADWGPNPNRWNFSAVNGLLYNLDAGVTAAAARVFDPTDYYSHEFWPWLRDFGDHCLTRNITQLIGLSAGYLVLDNPDSALVFSSPDSYLEIGGASGPFPIAAIADPDTHPDWRLFVLPDINMFCNDPEHGNFFNLADHRQFAKNIVFWCPCESAEECDDGVFCNGAEYCDDVTLKCASPEDPCGDDEIFCNGVESCDENADQCLHSGDPCVDDGQFCNGDEICVEESGACVSEGNPCPDDGLYCNGDEICVEADDACGHAGDPCGDDGVFCNGGHACNEDEDVCEFTGFPCRNDGLWCNGEESCDEDLDRCNDVSAPCPDDGLWCNGEATCDEDNDECQYTGQPCEDDEYCDENHQQCIPNEENDDLNDDWMGDDDGDDDDNSSVGKRPGADDEDQGDWWPLGDLSGGCCAC